MSETRFHLARAETDLGPIALLTIDNGEDHTKPTTFGRAALESLARRLDEIEREQWAGLVLTGKPFVFAAGADIDQFPNASAEFAREGSRAGHELFGRIRSLPFPTLAAINGACLGGGVEIALHCEFRTISRSVRHFGFPEVFLGIIPAWGGTQLVPRLAGVAAAVKLVVDNPLRQNRLLDGGGAVELGLADELLEPVEFLDDSLSWLLARIRDGSGDSHWGGNESVTFDPQEVSDLLRKARARVDDQVHGAAPAPYLALDLIEGATTWSLEEGLRREEDALAELLPGPQAQASIYAFDLVERRAKKRRPKGEPRAIEKVAIVGAGLMASQLAALFLRRLEVPIVLRDVRQEAIDEALASIRDDLAGQVAKGRYDEAKARFLGSIVSGSTMYDGWSDADLVLEAVFEEMSVKRAVFAELEAIVRDDAALATNTSALSVTEMAHDLRHPERVVGMHFFNPVALMPLVEVVRTPETDAATLATAWAVAERLRKRPVLVRDAPGFVVNRVLTRMTSTLMQAIEAGNSTEDTDEAVLRLGLPMAPSVLLAMVGPRVANHVLETMHEEYPDRFPLSPTLAALADGRDELHVAAHEPRPVDELTDAVLEALADEIRHLLEEGVVDSAADVDTCLLLGAGFPFFLGGITRHLDETGISERVAGRRLADVGEVVRT